MTNKFLKTGILKRSSFVALLLLSAFLFLALRLFLIQVTGFERYQQKVIDQLTTESPVPAARGEILDATGRVLATNRTVYRVSLFPSVVAHAADSERLQTLIAEELPLLIEGLTTEKMREHLSHTTTLQRIVAKDLEANVADSVLAFVTKNRLFDMVAVEAMNTRYYPYGTLAAHTLGFTGSDTNGLYGLELQYNNALSGVPGSYVTARDSTGNELPDQYAAYIPAVDGNTLHTTIDAYIQAVLEEQLESTMIESGAANRVAGVVMNVKTGAVLAMATAPDFDLNAPFTLNEESSAMLEALGLLPGSEEYNKAKNQLLLETWSNKAVTEIYMPGSTFKALTCSMVLEEGAVTDLSEHFFCSGALAVADRIIHCHKKGGHGSLTFTEGLQNSCNPVMMTIAARIGSDCFYNYVKKFGMLQKTGIDLPGEGNSIFHAQSSFTSLDLATASFGQNFKVSILQMISAISAIANGGRMQTPYLVQKITDAAGQTVYEREITSGQQVISADTAATVAKILEGGVSGEGGARNAYVPGYRVAAKTGTSEKIGDDRNARIGSCVGFAPADDPEIAVIIVVDEPTDGSRYGSVVAAPYVGNLFAAALPYLGVEPVYTEEEAANLSIRLPDCAGMTFEEATTLFAEAGIGVKFVGEGEKVIAQMPVGGSMILKNGASVVLTLGEGKPQEIVVPNVIGLDAATANQILTNLGLNIAISGAKDYLKSDKIVSAQLPASGTSISAGGVVTLYFPYDEYQE